MAAGQGDGFGWLWWAGIAALEAQFANPFRHFVDELGADLLVIATDVDGVYTGWGTPKQKKLGAVTVDEVISMNLPAGSMGPKVAAACQFAANTGNESVIGSLADIDKIVEGSAGTRVRT